MLLYFVGDACVSISFFVLWPYFYKDSLGRAAWNRKGGVLALLSPEMRFVLPLRMGIEKIIVFLLRIITEAVLSRSF